MLYSPTSIRYFLILETNVQHLLVLTRWDALEAWVLQKYKRVFSLLQLWSFLESSSSSSFGMTECERRQASFSFLLGTVALLVATGMKRLQARVLRAHLYSFFSSDQECTVEAGLQGIPTYWTFIHTTEQCQSTWTRFILAATTARGALWEHI